MSYVRDYAEGESYAVIGLAIGGDQDVSVGGVRSDIYRDAVKGAEVNVSDGPLSFHVRGNSAGIYMLDGLWARSASMASTCAKAVERTEKRE